MISPFETYALLNEKKQWEKNFNIYENKYKFQKDHPSAAVLITMFGISPQSHELHSDCVGL